MEVTYKGATAQPQIQTSSLAPNPNPAAAPPWASSGGAPQVAALPPGVGAALAPAVAAVGAAIGGSWVQSAPGVQHNQQTGSRIIDTTQQRAPAPAPPQMTAEELAGWCALAAGPFPQQLDARAQLFWCMSHAGDPAVDGWSAEQPWPADVYEAAERVFLATRPPPDLLAPLAPVTRAQLEGQVRGGKSDEEILGLYVSAPQITRALLGQLRAALAAAPALAPALTTSGGAPPTASKPPSEAGGAPPGATAAVPARSAAGGPRWSQAKRERATVLLQEGRAVADVAADGKVAMPVDKVEELRIELVVAQKLQPLPVAVQSGAVMPGGAVQPPPPQVAVAAAAQSNGQHVQHDTTPAFTSVELAALRRLFDDARSSEDPFNDDEWVRLDRALFLLPETDEVGRARLAAARTARETIVRAPGFALVCAYERAKAAVRAYEKLRVLLPTDGGA